MICTQSCLNRAALERVPARESYQTDRGSGLRLRVPLINNPKILFSDEPTANPDSVSSRQILELFRDTGQMILMVTHEPRDVDLVDRVIWLVDGEVVEWDG